MTDIPDEDELRVFLHRMIVEAHRMGDATRVDDLLDKIADVDMLRTYLSIVLR